MVNNLCIVGAGISGLCVAVQLIRKCNTRDFVIFDQNSDVGGSWLTQSYPGLSSDIPGQLCSFSFESNADWKHVYPTQQEMLNYLKAIASRYGINEHIRFRRTVKKLTWLESHKKWKAEVLDMNNNVIQEYLFPLVVVAAGQNGVPHIPDIFHKFSGQLIHITQWDDSIDLLDKNVAIYGNDNSAIKLIPEISEKVKRLIWYQRKNKSLSCPIPPKVSEKKQHKRTRFTRWCLCRVPGMRRLHHCLTVLMNETKNWASHNLGRKTVGKSYYPTYERGKSKYFSKMLSRPNVTIIPTDIYSVVGNSVLSDGGDRRKVDIIVLVTRFQSDEYFAPLRISGQGGEDVVELWKRSGEPRGYFGTFFPELPNMFFINGPTQAIRDDETLVFECQARMVIKVLHEMRKQYARRVCLKLAAVQPPFSSGAIESTWINPDCFTSKNLKKSCGCSDSLSVLFFWWKTKNLRATEMFHFK